MINREAITAAFEAVVAIRDNRGSIVGTGVVVAPNTVLTSRHVIQEQPATSFTINGQSTPNPAVTLPTRRYGAQRRLARISHRRADQLTGLDTDTVDLALITVPGLTTSVAPLRRTPVQPGERVAIAGFPNGRWTITFGPITSTDEADYVAHVLLGPGSSGAPAIDSDGRISGILTLDHPTAGAILIGPQLIAQFTHKTQKTIHITNDCPWCTPHPQEQASK